ncbi:hypothetical protein K1T71_015245 [Dendrolimus kikuchii]|nr:hypothetical protein K1T71_015245 [Dendrolimus kikuchii]
MQIPGSFFRAVRRCGSSLRDAPPTARYVSAGSTHDSGVVGHALLPGFSVDMLYQLSGCHFYSKARLPTHYYCVVTCSSSSSRQLLHE